MRGQERPWPSAWADAPDEQPGGLIDRLDVDQEPGHGALIDPLAELVGIQARTDERGLGGNPLGVPARRSCRPQSSQSRSSP
jgi:hypothetical protein